MKHIDLFSGIGGFAISAKKMGWETIQFCEIDPFARQVLTKNFPGVPISTDIFNLHINECTEPTILTGSTPCQPFSIAGKRKGISDSRALWPEMFRIICECKPAYIVAENVSGLLSISGGMVFEHICLDLESEGYEVQSFIIPAIGIGCFHKRDRVWIVAAKANGYSTSKGLQECKSSTKRIEAAFRDTNSANESRIFWPSESPVHSATNELPTPLVRNRAKQIKHYGNAIVPGIALQIFKAIEAIR